MLKGNVTIIFRDKNTKNETKKRIILKNFIHERFYRIICGSNNRINRPSTYNIFISNDINYTYPQDKYNYSIVSSNNAIGILLTNGIPYTLIGTRSVEQSISDIKNPHFIIARRFLPIGVNRAFNIVGLTDSSSSSIINPLTSLIIPDGCNQGPTEELTIYYNIELSFKDNKFKSTANLYNLCAALCIHGDIRGSFIMKPSYHEPCLSRKDFSSRGYDYLYSGPDYFYITNEVDSNEGRNLCQISNVWYSDPSQSDLERTGYGSVFNTVLIGTFGRGQLLYDKNYFDLSPKRITTNIDYNGEIEGYGSVLNWMKYIPEESQVLNMPLQSKYMKKKEAYYPYFNLYDIPNNNSKINISIDGDWNPFSRFPEIFRVQITKEGIIGVSEYQIWVKKFAQMSKKRGNILTSTVNNYRDSDCNVNESNSFLWQNETGHPISFLHPYVKHKNHHGSFIYYPKLVSPWNKEEIFMYDRTGITLLNLYTSEYITWDTNANPPFRINLSQIRQISFDKENNYIYVACQLYGLYRINILNLNIVRLSIDPCYAVDVGFNSKVFAIFEGRMSNSDDWNASIPFIAKYINGSHLNLNISSIWKNVQFIKINRISNSYEMAIITSSFSSPPINNHFHLSTSLVINWWSLNSAIDIELSSISTNSISFCFDTNSIEYWEKGDRWITKDRIFKFNDTSSISYSSFCNGYYVSLNDTKFSMFNKDIDNWKWFRTTDSIIPNISSNFRPGNPVIWNGLLISDKVYEGIDEDNNLLLWNNINLNVRKFFNIDSCLILDGDLFLYSSLDDNNSLRRSYSLFNIFSNQSNEQSYKIKDTGWDKYGWNGLNWIKDFNGSKLTHSNSENSINNINLSFEGYFEQEQYLLQYICFGLFHDNSTFFKVQSIETYLPRVTVSFPEFFLVQGDIIPGVGIKILFPHSSLGINPDPLFYTIEACNRSSMVIKVNNINRYIFYNNVKVSPDIGEVILFRDNSTNPTNRENYYLIFNQFDLNKTITGEYSYLQFPRIS